MLVAYDDIRAANAKMIELKYEKEVNEKLRSIIVNDSIIIEKLEFNVNATKKQLKKAITREHIAEGVSILSIIGFVISLCK